MHDGDYIAIDMNFAWKLWQARAKLAQTQTAPSVPNEIADFLPRAIELANRLTASGPKCCAVSASETHEIKDFVLLVCGYFDRNAES